MAGNPGVLSSLDQRYLSRQSYSPNHTFTISIPDECVPSPSSKRSFESRKVFDRISTFCSKDNFPQRISFLEQELAVYGYPSIKIEPVEDDETPPSGLIDIVNLVNISYDLLRMWRQAMDARNDATDLQRSSDAEVNRLNLVASRLKEEIAGKERDLKSKDLLQHQLSQRVEELKKKVKVEQERARRLTSEMTARDTQFRHEKKKKMQEIDKLQFRLQQLLQDKRQERMLGIEILNSLQRTDGRRGKWHNDQTKKNNEQDMYRLIINNYEDSQRQLLKENEGMRQYLKEMQDELISALNERTTMDQSGASQGKLTNGEDRPSSVLSSDSASNKSENSEPMSDGMFEMPYDLVKEDIEKSIRGKWRALKREMKRTRRSRTMQSQRFTPNDRTYEDLVSQQQELIDYLTSGKSKNGERPIPEDSYFLEEKAELDEKKEKFFVQKQALDKERQLYADALLQLDDQRQEFEFEKSQWYHKNFLQLTPFRNDGHPTSSPHEKTQTRSSSHQDKVPKLPRSKNSSSPDGKIKPRQSSEQKSIQSPNSLTQSLSRLHSSSYHSAFSPENPRRSDWQWTKVTPDQGKAVYPQKTKSTPTNSIRPPSTAELYRTLGLVYPGSDKENEDSLNTPNGSSPQVCPRSSGKTFHQGASLQTSVGEKLKSQTSHQRKRSRSRRHLASTHPICQIQDDSATCDTSKNLHLQNFIDFQSGCHGNSNLSSHAKNYSRNDIAKNLELAYLRKKWKSVSELNPNQCRRPRTRRAEIIETRPRCNSTPSASNRFRRNAEDSDDSTSSQLFVSANTSLENFKVSTSDPLKRSEYGRNVPDDNFRLKKSQACEKLFIDDNNEELSTDDQSRDNHLLNKDADAEKPSRKSYGLKHFMRSILSPKWRDENHATISTRYSILEGSPQPSAWATPSYDNSNNGISLSSSEFGCFDRSSQENPFCNFNMPARVQAQDLVSQNFVGEKVICSSPTGVTGPISLSTNIVTSQVAENMTSPCSDKLSDFKSQFTQNLMSTNSLPALTSSFQDHRRRSKSYDGVLRHPFKMRSYSFESATLTDSAVRHKAALFSFSAKLKPISKNFNRHADSLDISSCEDDRVFEQNDTAALSESQKTSCDDLVNLTGMQFSNGLYDKWTHTSQSNPVESCD